MTQARKNTHGNAHREFTVVLEGLRSDFKAFGEGLAALTEKVDRLTEKVDRLEKKVDHLEEDMAAVKRELRLIREELKTKIGYDEFRALEKRVAVIEREITSRARRG